jgi:serine/threonine protein phosphatase 1
VIVHGHTPVPEPQLRDNHVNLDTGAFSTGILTALVVDGADKRLLRAGKEII